MGRIKPQPRILSIWRILLTLVMVLPAFANALFFPARGRAWLIITIVWVIVYLALFLVYLPLRYNKLSYSVGNERILLYSGALYTNVRVLPLQNIQYVSIYQNPIERLFGLCTLVAVAAGGRISLPGLRRQDAESLAKALLP